MNNTAELYNLLEQRKVLFERYEQATSALKTCDVDAMENYITTRTSLAIEIDRLSEKTYKVIQNMDNKSFFEVLLKNDCARGDVPADLLDIYDLSQSTLGSMSRIVEMDAYIVCRMQAVQDELKEKIKASNQTPKINRYLTNLSSVQTDSTMLQTRYGKI